MTRPRIQPSTVRQAQRFTMPVERISDLSEKDLETYLELHDEARVDSEDESGE